MTSSTLTLPDGTTYVGRLQRDDDGRPVIDVATCGACGFQWNDALITSVTPAPSGRCPNERAHVDPMVLDMSARAGRTRYRLRVKDARELRMSARHQLGNSREDVPTVADLLRAAKMIDRMLYDATRGDARLAVAIGGYHSTPTEVLRYNR